MHPIPTRSPSAVLAMALLLLSPAALPAQDLRARISPEFMIPLADTAQFAVGGGAGASLELELAGFLSPYLGLDLVFLGMRNDTAVTVASGGAGLGAFMYPVPRLRLGLSAGAGAYMGSYENDDGNFMTGNLFWRAGAEAGYRLRPSMTLSAGASYLDYRRRADSFWQGLSFTLVLDLATSSSAVGYVSVSDSSSVPVFPTLAGSYATAPFGQVTIRNAESAEVRDVELWFQSEGYTSAPVLCATIPWLGKGKTAVAPLLASFGDAVLGITDSLKVRGELTIRYRLLGEPRVTANELTVSFNHRNAITWQDPRILASFASPNDPAVLDMSKFVAGVVRSRTRAELDSNLQYALGLFEGLRLAGITWVADPQTPYARMRADPAAVDYVQYPHQTLAYRSGDSDDLAVLYAAALESVGVPAALIPLDGEVLVAFKMTQDESATRGSFSEAGDFIFIDGEAWVPVRVTLMREGFLRAWTEGAKAAAATGAKARFFRLSDGWRDFGPIGIPGISPTARKPAEDSVAVVFENAVGLVVAREVSPRADRMRKSFGAGGGTGRQRNSLGILYARYGMYAEAREEFQAAAAMDYHGAFVNMGNVAFLLGDFAVAETWFRKASTVMPDDPAVIIGLARTMYELDRYEEADALFRRAIIFQPELAVRYGYLSASIGGSGSRASAVADRGGGMMWDE